MKAFLVTLLAGILAALLLASVVGCQSPLQRSCDDSKARAERSADAHRQPPAPQPK